MSAVGVDARVTGGQRYAVDAERPGMLHAAFVRSPTRTRVCAPWTRPAYRRAASC